MKAADGRHLTDDQMIAVYIGAEPRFGRGERHLDHLQGCGACARRYEQIVLDLDTLRDDAIAEADAVFSPARLEMQRLQILERLEHAAHPARVIRFPSQATQSLSIFTGPQVRRWIAAAAAAGLLIGLTLGRMTDFPALPANPAPHAVVAPSPRPVAETVRPGIDTRPNNDEEILFRAEQVQGGEIQLPASLEALGAITPIREVAYMPPRH